MAELELDEESGAPQPLAWRLDATERLLFKKFMIEGRAEYAGFAWK